MLQVRYPATWFFGTFLLAMGLSHRADAGEPPKKVRLVGIYKVSDGPAATRIPVIESAIASRLHGLEWVLDDAPAYAESCKEASCLPQEAEKSGADLALTGTVYRAADLCTADLRIYERGNAESQHAQIRCHSETSEESLATEFAEQVGRLSERQQSTLLAQTAAPQQVSISMAPPTPKVEPPWDLKRKTAIPILGATAAGFLGASIMTWIVYSDSSSGLRDKVMPTALSLSIVAGISTAGIITAALIWGKKR